MDTKLLNEVIDCLPKGKTHFRYFSGAYAPMLLDMLMPETVALAELKKSRYGKLLHNKLLKPLVANAGDGRLSRAAVSNIWQEPSLPFLLSVSRWDARKDWMWNQVTRRGENLVLQLNLPKQHERLFQQWLSPKGEFNFNWGYGHPVQRKRAGHDLFRETLAWARIDLDLDNNEALIEEVQSDGARKMASLAKQFKGCSCQQCQQRLRYIDWFQPYAKLWSEAMLMASLHFLKHEMGIEHVYMHTARSGWQLKHMEKNWQPPKSLYSDLPKKFTFQKTCGAPLFLRDTKPYQKLIRQQPDIDFHYLSLATSTTPSGLSSI